MIEMSKEEIQKVNEQCQNGWAYCIHSNGKYEIEALNKKIDINDKACLEFILYYNEDSQIVLDIVKLKNDIHSNNSDKKIKSKVLYIRQFRFQQLDRLIKNANLLTDEKLLEINKKIEGEF